MINQEETLKTDEFEEDKETAEIQNKRDKDEGADDIK